MKGDFSSERKGRHFLKAFDFQYYSVETSIPLLSIPLFSSTGPAGKSFRPLVLASLPRRVSIRVSIK